MTWLEEAQTISLAQVLAAFGDFTIKRSTFGPCPACHEQLRDRGRGACGTRGEGWRCWKCNQSGSTIQLVFWRLNNREPRPGDNGWHKVHDWYASFGWCEGKPGQPVRVAPVAPKFVVPSIERPPVGEVLGMLRSLTAPAKVKEPKVLEWFKSRSFDPERIPGGILPKDYYCPKWWPFDSYDTTRFVYRYMVPAYDHQGKVRSVHARAVLSNEDMIKRGLCRNKRDGGKEVEKTRWPAGYSSVGLIFADPWKAARMLRRDPLLHPVRRVVIAEGITDFAAAAAAFRDNKDTAVFGGTSGAWATFGLVPWYATTEFYIATDPDPTGDRYAAEIVSSLSRYSCYRVPLRSLVAA